MILLKRKVGFSAAHSYRIASWSEEKNKEIFGLCSNPNGHGHDYTLEVTVEGSLNKKSGIVVNISDVDKVVKSVVEEELDGKFLNREHSYFIDKIPTTENIILFLWGVLEKKFENCILHSIQLRENPFLCSQKERGPLVQLTRKYHFSSAHRLHSNQLSDKENIEIFGKCNNIYGHGHNYYLEITVKGEVDPVTGMVINLADLDRIVNQEVIEKVDHKHLNLDTEEFKDLNPTAEVMTMVFWKSLAEHLPNLHKIGLWETEKNYFEYSEPIGGTELR